MLLTTGCGESRWGGNVGLGGEGKSLPEAKLEVTTGNAMDRRGVPITRHMLESSFSAGIWGPSGTCLLILALQCLGVPGVSTPFPILSRGRQPHGILCLGTWLFGTLRGDVVKSFLVLSREAVFLLGFGPRSFQKESYQ